MDRRVPLIDCLVLLVLLARSVAFPSAQGRPTPLEPAAYGGATRIISPAVVATWMTSRSRNGIEQLQLIVLWRGAPGWFLRGGKNGVSSNQSGTQRSELIIYGDVRLTVRFDSAKQIAVINDRPIDVAKDNVVFVDDVDSPTGARVVRTSSVNLAMPGSAGQIGLVLKTSPEIMSFLRCDAPVREHPQREYLGRLCLETIGVPK